MKKPIWLILLGIIIAAAIWNSSDGRKNSSKTLNKTPPKSASQPKLNNAPKPVSDPKLNSAPQAGNSKSVQPKKTICISCKGSGSCPVCRGTGRYSNYGFTSGCSACDDYGSTIDKNGKPNGNGKCSTCHGTRFTQ